MPNEEIHPPTRTTADLLQAVVGDVQDIIRSEIRLAKAELKEESSKAVKAGAMFAGGGLMALFGLALLMTACVAALAMAMPVWAAAAVMCVLCFAIGGTLYVMGRSRAKDVHAAPKTISTVKEDIQWAKNQMR